MTALPKKLTRLWFENNNITSKNVRLIIAYQLISKITDEETSAPGLPTIETN